jgi:hypothetical protein
MKHDQKYLTQASNAPHTGELLKDFFKKRRIRKAALSRLINRSPKTLATYGKNSTLQTAILWEICHALKHNFFADIAAQLPPTYTTQAPADSTQNDRIAALEQEIALLKAKNESLMEALKGK